MLADCLQAELFSYEILGRDLVAQLNLDVR